MADGKLITDHDSVLDKQSRFLPEIPGSKTGIELPPALLDSITKTQILKKSHTKNEISRIDETAEAMKKSHKEISAAENRLEEIDQSFGLQFLGIFDADYNRQHQANRMQKANNEFKRKVTELSLQSNKEKLQIANSEAVVKTYQDLVNLKLAGANLTVAQSNAIIQSNAAKKQLQEMLFNSMTHQEIMGIKKAKKFNDVATPGAIRDYESALKKMQLDFEAANLSNNQKRLDLGIALEERAWEQAPLPWMQAALDVAETQKQQFTKIPNTEIVVPITKLRTKVADKQLNEKKAMENTAIALTTLAAEDGEVSSLFNEATGLSAIYSGGGVQGLDLQGLNMLNVTDEQLQKINIDAMHPTLRKSLLPALQGMAVLNQKQKDGESVTIQDMFTLKQLVKTASNDATVLKTDIIESSPKDTRPAMKEWFASGGQIKNQDNAASLVISNISTLPDLGGDIGLDAAYQMMIQNYANSINGTQIDWAELDEDERTNLIMESIASSKFKSKEEARDILIRVANTKNENGQTPKSAYVNTRAAEVFAKSFVQLKEKYPKLAPFLELLATDTQYQQPRVIANQLANMSFQIQQKYPKKFKDNFLNEELNTIMNNVIAKEGPTWSQPNNPVHASIMTLIFNGNPMQVVDTALTSVYGEEAAITWDLLKEASKQKEIAEENAPATVRELKSFKSFLENRFGNPFGFESDVPEFE